MPGTIIFKPIEANITIKDQDILGKMDPYCIFHVGLNKIKGSVCKSGGNHPVWHDEIPIDIKDQSICTVELKDKDMLIDEKLGTFEIDLREIESQGKIRKWYPLFHKDKPAGEVLLEAFLPNRLASQQGFSQGLNQGLNQQGLNQPSLSSQGHNQGVYQQGLNQPSLSSQGVSQGYTQQEVYRQQGLPSQGLSQGLSSQGLNQGLSQQGLNQPNLSSQGLNQGVYQQGLNQPSLSSQGISQGYTQQGLNKPGFSSQGLSQGLPQPTVSQTFPQQGIYQPGQFSQTSVPLSYAEEALLRGTDPTNLQQKLSYNASQSQGLPGQSLIGSGQLLNQSSNIVRTDELLYEGDVNRFNHPPYQMPFGHGHHTSQDPLNPQKKL